MATFWPATNPASFKPCSNAVTRCSEPAADVLRRNPITGTADCCARAVNGHATTVLLESLMNSRRLMASPAPRACIGCKKEYHKFRSRIVPFVAPKRQQCPLWVKSGHRSTSGQYPLYPQKRTLELNRAMSALCAKSRQPAAIAVASDGPY